MKIMIIGGAGFIGSHLTDKLVKEDHIVTIYDNLSTGKQKFVDQHLKSWKANLIINDVLKFDNLKYAMKDHDVVFHLSANSQANLGFQNTQLDLEQGIIATYNALEAARLNRIKEFIFSSSGTVYGNNENHCVEKDLGDLPISLYGAAKFAGEALISAYVEGFDFKATIFRFGNVIGPNSTHGAIYDFCNKLQKHPEYLDVLGDGSASKPYIPVKEIVDGILYSWKNRKTPLDIYNIAPEDFTTVRYIAECVVKNSPYPKAEIRYGEGKKGWKGDVSKSRISMKKLNELGFFLKLSSNQAVEKSVKEITQEIFNNRRA
jgi:UDP-glucose 4-epimerase